MQSKPSGMDALLFLIGAAVILFMLAVCVFAFLVYAVPPARAGTLDDAVFLVLSESPGLDGKRTAAAELAGVSDWTSTIKLSAGYAEKQTDEFAGGFDARGMIALEIPLTGRPSSRLDAAKARAALGDAQDGLIAEFLRSAAGLAETLAKAETADILHQFALDKLEYFKNAESAGELEPARLWEHAEQSAKAGEATGRARVEYAAGLEVAARRFGGGRWLELRGLLDKFARESTQGLREQREKVNAE
jgi:hypothetical protein